MIIFTQSFLQPYCNTATTAHVWGECGVVGGWGRGGAHLLSCVYVYFLFLSSLFIYSDTCSQPWTTMKWPAWLTGYSHLLCLRPRVCLAVRVLWYGLAPCLYYHLSIPSFSLRFRLFLIRSSVPLMERPWDDGHVSRSTLILMTHFSSSSIRFTVCRHSIWTLNIEQPCLTVSLLVCG